jgi:predicted transposase YbfD/YdcC
MEIPFMSVLYHELVDPRVKRTRKHRLKDIVIISVLAVICGADGWEEIEAWGKAWEPWLRLFLRLPWGIPSYHTFRRLFSALDKDAFNTRFLEWTRCMFGSTEGKTIALDGKKLRGSYQSSEKNDALHLVSAWVAENHAVFGQVATQSKSNEITAIPELLKLLCLKGATVTIDAMGCQKKIVEQIVEGEADYVITVKDNQPTLHEEVQLAFVTADIAEEETKPEWVYETSEKGHGRHEVRKVRVLDAEQRLNCDEQWAGLRSLVMVESERTCKGRTSYEMRYYISSHAPDAKKIAEYIRGHWGIENRQHWTLDVVFDEDRSRIQNTNARMNFAVLRRIALNILKLDQEDKRSLRVRRYAASMGPKYLEKILRCAAEQLSKPTGS